jgi:hypothetical protein
MSKETTTDKYTTCIPIATFPTQSHLHLTVARVPFAALLRYLNAPTKHQDYTWILSQSQKPAPELEYPHRLFLLL